MKVIDFTGDSSQISWPEEYVAELESLSPIAQLRYFYTNSDYVRWKKDLAENGFEWQNPRSLYTLPVDAVEMLDGKIAAVHHGGSRLVLGERVCTYSASDNNGAGYKEREDYATLICGEPIDYPRDFYRVEGDTVTFSPNMPEYPYAFMYVYVKPWEREAECPIRHVVVEEGATFLPKYMLDWMPDLETVHVPSSIKAIGSQLPENCQLFVGGIRLPDCVVSWDGILVRVRESVEEMRVMGTIKRIGRYAFADCPNLKLLIIPENVQEIEEGTFAEFDDSLTIYCEAARCPEGWHLEEMGGYGPRIVWGWKE